MRYLKIFNEFNDPYDEYINKLQDFCESYLIYLLDKGFVVKVQDNKVNYEPIKIDISTELLPNIRYDITNRSFYWSEVKDYVIPFLQVLSENYELDGDNAIELHEIEPQNVSTGSSMYSYLYSLDDVVDEKGDFTYNGYHDDTNEISYISIYLKQPKPLD